MCNKKITKYVCRINECTRAVMDTEKKQQRKDEKEVKCQSVRDGDLGFGSCGDVQDDPHTNDVDELCPRHDIEDFQDKVFDNDSEYTIGKGPEYERPRQSSIGN